MQMPQICSRSGSDPFVQRKNQPNKHSFCFDLAVVKSIFRIVKYVFMSFVIFLTGCAAIEKENQANTENLLSAAGFRILPANSPKRQESLKSMVPYKLERKIKGEEVFYLYACPDHNFAYIGDQSQYSRYRELELQQEIANQNTMSSQNAVIAAQQWNDWRVWGPSAFLPAPRMGRMR